MENLKLLPPLSERIEEGLPCLVWDRLPGYEHFSNQRWLKVEDGQGEFLSWGLVDAVNNTLHLLSDSEDPLQGVKERFALAFERRRELNWERDEVCRWVNGPGDRLSGFALDSFGSTFVLSVAGSALGELARELSDFLVEALKPERLVLKLREKGRELDDSVPEEMLYGDRSKDKIIVKERGLKYYVQPMDMLNTGLFSDLRGMRLRLREVSQEAAVLNLFSYTASFSLVSALSGAKCVRSVDTSSSCHAWARKNFILNGLEGEDARFEFAKADVFRYLEKQVKQSKLYDCIVLDPPARARHGTGRFFLKSDLPRLIDQCLRVLKPGGRLFVTDNTLQGTEKKLRSMVSKGAKRAGTAYEIVKVFDPEPDFPVHKLWPKGRGVIALEVLKAI